MLAWLALAAVVLGQQPIPQPFPRPGATSPARPDPPAPAPQQPPPSQPVAPPQASQAATDAPSDAMLGVQVMPGAQFIRSFDAGRGQRYYLFGTTQPFVAVVTYYRTLLKQRGELVFEAPATHQFDIGRFREETMAFPPSVTVKDYQSDISQGYPNPKVGEEPARFPTIIQIVPPVERER
jgi:hypothetical protein